MSQTVPRSRDTRWLALVVLCAGALMTILDQTVVNVSLQSIQRDLGFSQSGLAWVVNAYLIAYGGLLLLAGRLGDLLGRPRIFATGLVVFTVASVLCGVSSSRGQLVAARFVQGAGGAMTMSVVLGMIVTLFPAPAEQARAIGVFSFVAAAGGSIGLLAGGVLTETINWHWIFFVNAPIGVAAVVLARRYVQPERGIGLGAGADIAGAVLITSALMLAVYAIVGITDHGAGSAQTIGTAVVAVSLLTAFVVRQARAANPLVPLRVFRSRVVTGANVVHGLMVGGMFGFFFLGALYVQRVLGYEPIATGLAFLPIAIVIGGLNLFVTPRLLTRMGPRAVLLPGLALIVTGLVLLALAPVGGAYLLHVFPSTVLAGAGGGLAMPSLMTLAMSGATPEEAGLASGLVTTSEQVGGALTLAVLATAATSRTDQLLARGSDLASALTTGYHLAFVLGAVIVAAAAVVAVTVLRSPAPADDDETELLEEELAVA